MSVNILISSVGRRVQLIQYFKEELNKVGGKVIAVDCDPTAPALYHADSYEIVPRIHHPAYLEHMKEMCKMHSIDGVLSVIDPELSILAAHKEEFAAENVKVLLSEKEVVDLCYDKLLTYQFLRDHHIDGVPTYAGSNHQSLLDALKNQTIQFPLVMKPKNGSASLGVTKIATKEQLMMYLEKTEGMIFQQLMSGDEYCVEAYVDFLSDELIQMFCKRKINMRSGETDKSISIIDRELMELTEKIIAAVKPSGPVDIDLFKTEDGYVVSEINPRFGGGYPYAHEMGNNFIKNMINNLEGISNIPWNPTDAVMHYQEGKTMVRYDRFTVL